MLAHCNVSYEMAFGNIHQKPNALMRFILKMMVKNTVVNEVPYKKNSSTAPAFVIKDEKNFEAEKARLKAYIIKTQELGATHFEGKESHSFGTLTSTEWNNMFYKHLDHHLGQFGV
jgi:SRSO17 transposase